MKKLLCIVGVLTITLVVGGLIASFFMRASHNKNRSIAKRNTNSLTAARANQNIRDRRVSDKIATKPMAPAQAQPLRTTVTQANFVQGRQPTIQKSTFNPIQSTRPVISNPQSRPFRAPPTASQNRPRGNALVANGAFANQASQNSASRFASSSQSQPFQNPNPPKPTPKNAFGASRNFPSNGFAPAQTSPGIISKPNTFGPSNRIASKSSIWPLNAKNVKNLVRTEYFLPSSAADSIVDFFAADDNKEIETKITKPEDSSDVLVKLVVTTDETTQRAIASFLDAVYPAKRIASIKQASEQELEEAIGDDVSPAMDAFREPQPEDDASSNSEWKSREVERKVDVKKQDSGELKTVDDLLNLNESVSQTLKELDELIARPKFNYAPIPTWR